mgnify:CR=1 FL=1
MEIYKKIHSKIDKSIKYVFLSEDKLAIEATYIDKDDGKNIICLPTQTSCSIGCKFCHITDIAEGIKLRNIKSNEIVDMTHLIYNNLNLSLNPKTLLLSFMGCGEPILNSANLVNAMTELQEFYSEIPLIRFALATSIPYFAVHNFNQIVKGVKENNINLKIHLSLHYTDDETREEWMPKSLNITDSISLLKYYQTQTGNKVEIHYTLIDGVNNKEENIEQLILLLKGENIPIKFLFFNEKDINYHASPDSKNSKIINELTCNNIQVEYYLPPALDIGGSCGQLLKEYYIQFNSK